MDKKILEEQLEEIAKDIKKHKVALKNLESLKQHLKIAISSCAKIKEEEYESEANPE